MTRKDIVIALVALVAQLVVLVVLFTHTLWDSSPLSWSYEGDYGICAVGQGSYADDAEEINRQISEILGEYMSASEDNHRLRYSILRSDSKLTILELVVMQANHQSGSYDLIREQLWLDTAERGRVALHRMGDPHEFLTYSQSFRADKPF